MKGLSVLVLVASLSFVGGAGLMYVAKTTWSSDMANQSSIKPQEGPLLPPPGSVATDLVSAAGAPGTTSGSHHQGMDHQHDNAAAKHDHPSKGKAQGMGHQHGPGDDAGGHHQGATAGKHEHSTKAKSQAMDHQHGPSAAAGHQHGAAGAKHEHSTAKAKSQGMGHQHGAGDASGHQHGGSSSAKHDHGAKTVSPPKAKDFQPLPTDLMGSAGTGPGKTIQSAGGEEKAHDHGTGGHDHGSKAAPKGPAKASQPNRSSAPHSLAPGAAHDHGTSRSGGHQHSKSAPHKHDAAGHSHGNEKTEKMKTGGSSAMHQHKHGAGAADGHAHGETQAQIVNPIKPTEASVKKGQLLFNSYCSVCHGPEGRGGTPMESKLPGIPKFTGELLRSVDDTHMFSMITSGHGPMPGYAEALTPEERWHVANYVRTLQKKLSSEKEVARGASR